MLVSETKIRVRYAETDQMGYVYYGHYATYYEVGRVEIMRSLGVSYKEMEARGCKMPLVEMDVKYLKPAKYDDLLRIKTTIKEIPAVKMSFYYEIFNDDTNELINTGTTILTFINSETYKPMRAPQWFLELLQNKINH